MERRINLYLQDNHIDDILDALRDEAHHADKPDKWLELLGEVLAQRTINDRHYKMENNLFVDARKTMIVKESKMNTEPIKSFRHKTGTRDKKPVYKKYEGLKKYAPHDTFEYSSL